MGIAEDIKQPKFKNEFQKATINLFYTASWVGEKHHTFFKGYGITAAQFNVLRILRGQYPQPSTVNLIIDRMIDRMSNASRIVDKLESKELVIRKQCPNDRRAVDVLISDKGLKLLSEMDDEMEVYEKKICNLTEEEAVRLNDLLDKFRSV
ncbi:MAG: MarR family transcriptional regulator [Imperialibacter sp.]|uniref:MarR family winged helix-turn-helix transcriptional regulator n=1 Tax=Imperialibacter sp. TaxID=2038411 RepID=UPI0032F03D3C